MKERVVLTPGVYECRFYFSENRYGCSMNKSVIKLKLLETQKVIYANYCFMIKYFT